MADVVLRSETAGVCPDTEEALDTLRENVRSDPSMGSVLARQVRDSALRSYRLRWNDAGESERRKLLTAFGDAFGFVKAMDYTPVGDVDANKLEVTFVPGSVRIVQTAPDSYQMSADLAEVL